MSLYAAKFVMAQVKAENPKWRLYIQSNGAPDVFQVRAWEHEELVCKIESVADWVRS